MSEPVQPAAAPARAIPAEAKRTDPRSFIVQGILGLKNAVFPAVAGLFAFRGEGYAIFVAIAIAVTAFTVLTVMTYLGWRRFTYTVGDSDIRVESGIIARAARSVPYERIQDVSLEQALVPRLFGLVEVRFETGAGGKDELKLSYLPEAEGERLRELVRDRRDAEETGEAQIPAIGSEADTPAAPVPPARVLYRLDPRRLLTFGIFEFSLAIFAVLFGITQQFEFLLPFDFWDFGEWQHQLAGPGAQLAGLGRMAQVVGGIFAVTSLVLVGLATGVVRTVLRDWGFVLERTAKGFRRRRGLLTRTDVVMPVHRVQALQIRTGIIRYRFGWHALKFVSLAQDSGSASHVVAPFARLSEIAPIVKEAGFDMPGEELDWHRASRRYRFDTMLIESLIFLLLAIPIAILAPPWVVVFPLGMASVMAAKNLYAWMFHRHAADARQLIVTRGLMAPRTDIASQVKLHSVQVLQGPLAQYRGYATLHFGIAGETLHVEGVPVEEAFRLREHILARIVTTDFSRLNV